MQPQQYSTFYKTMLADYVQQVQDGTRIVGRLEKQAVDRWVNIYSKYDFREKELEIKLKFCSLLNVKDKKGKISQLRLAAWQVFTLAHLCLYNHDSDTKVIDHISLSFAGKNGKALDLNTPIITPSGWKTMGELQIGDQVFDENGKPCNVIGMTEDQFDREVYEVLFTNGDSIVADGEHEWLTTCISDYDATTPRRVKREKTKIRTTKEILKTLHTRARVIGDKEYFEYNHSIAIAGSLQYEQKELPIPPYILGVWLGDGSSDGAGMVCHIDDYPHYKTEFGKFGYLTGDTKTWGHGESNNVVHFTISKNSTGSNNHTKALAPVLRAQNLLQNKHIPRVYLESSIEDRLELLKGLMDTDGWCERKSRCIFCNTNEQLANDVYELVRSLGIKATIKEGLAKLNGEVISKG